MQETRGKKPKIMLYRHRKNQLARPPSTEDDFMVYASYLINAGGMFVGSLKVVRKTDSRLLFPFDGAATIGPFSSKSEALRAAEDRGREIVAADLKNPELS